MQVYAPTAEPSQNCLASYSAWGPDLPGKKLSAPGSTLLLGCGSQRLQSSCSVSLDIEAVDTERALGLHAQAVGFEWGPKGHINIRIQKTMFSRIHLVLRLLTRT